MRIGVFGGSFDPVHNAHLIVADSAARQLDLDVVRFIPAAIQPFKPEGHSADTKHRIAMLELSVQGRPGFVVDLREIDRGGISYTVETLLDLRRDFPQDELFLLVGADAARGLPRWREASRLAELAQIVAMSRTDDVPPAITRTITVPSIDVSATAVRRAVQEGESLRELVPDQVAEYIRIHDVYNSDE